MHHALENIFQDIAKQQQDILANLPTLILLYRISLESVASLSGILENPKMQMFLFYAN